MKSSWTGERLNISGITDPYQPLEGQYVVQACLEVCAEFQQPVSMFTRSPLIVRDIPILQELAAAWAIRILVSSLFRSRSLSGLEPGTVRPHHRFRTIENYPKQAFQLGSPSPL